MGRAAVFLDRDGVVNRSEVRDGKPYAPRALKAFRLLPGSAAAIARLKPSEGADPRGKAGPCPHTAIDRPVPRGAGWAYTTCWAMHWLGYLSRTLTTGTGHA